MRGKEGNFNNLNCIALKSKKVYCDNFRYKIGHSEYILSIYQKINNPRIRKFES